MTIDLFALAIPENLLARLVNELWINPSKAQRLALIQTEDAKCSLKAYEQTIDFMKKEMNGTDHEQIFLVLERMGWEAAFTQARAIFKQKRKKVIPITSSYSLYHQLATFLKTEFYAYIGYDETAISDEDFFALQEEGEAKLAKQMHMSSPDAAGNLVFLSLDRLKSKEIAELVPKMKQMAFIATLTHIKSLTKARKYACHQENPN